MKFDELESKLRFFETTHDQIVLPGIYMVARLDGRNFTKLTKEKHKFEAPFDKTFRDMMLETVKHLMNCGFKVLYGYSQSDEISILFHPEDESFSRKIRKYNSILAGEASAKFSLELGSHACFDCRVIQLPKQDLVVDYFRWRIEDAHRNALNAHCYWILRKEGRSSREATSAIKGISVSEKNELLFQRGINFNDIPNWQKRGFGVYWKSYEKVGYNPKTGESVATQRNKLHIEFELPKKDEYSEFIQNMIESIH